MDYLNIIIIVVIFLSFYVFFIIPQKREQENNKLLLNKLKKGDDLVMISGLCCKFSYFHDDFVVVEVDGEDVTGQDINVVSILIDKTKELLEKKNIDK